jgi:hypothetical protein
MKKPRTCTRPIRGVTSSRSDMGLRPPTRGEYPTNGVKNTRTRADFKLCGFFYGTPGHKPRGLVTSLRGIKA